MNELNVNGLRRRVIERGRKRERNEVNSDFDGTNSEVPFDNIQAYTDMPDS